MLFLLCGVCNTCVNRYITRYQKVIMMKTIVVFSSLLMVVLISVSCGTDMNDASSVIENYCIAAKSGDMAKCYSLSIASTSMYGDMTAEEYADEYSYLENELSGEGEIVEISTEFSDGWGLELYHCKDRDGESVTIGLKRMDDNTYRIALVATYSGSPTMSYYQGD